LVNSIVWPTDATETRGSNWSPCWLTETRSTFVEFLEAAGRGVSPVGTKVTTAGLTDGEQVSGISTRPVTSPAVADEAIQAIQPTINSDRDMERSIEVEARRASGAGEFSS
jgi:hypothetical protein